MLAPGRAQSHKFKIRTAGGKEDSEHRLFPEEVTTGAVCTAGGSCFSWTRCYTCPLVVVGRGEGLEEGRTGRVLLQWADPSGYVLYLFTF